MTTSRLVVVVLVVVAVSAAALGILADRARSQGNPNAVTYYTAECATAQPADGGKVYLYVVDQARHVVTVTVSGLTAASYQLPAEGAHWYSVTTGEAEPADGGQAYCFVIDQGTGTVYTFRDADFLGAEALPRTGKKLQ
jgi:hypothetical protein